MPQLLGRRLLTRRTVRAAASPYSSAAQWPAVAGLIATCLGMVRDFENDALDDLGLDHALDARFLYVCACAAGCQG